MTGLSFAAPANGSVGSVTENPEPRTGFLGFLLIERYISGYDFLASDDIHRDRVHRRLVTYSTSMCALSRFVAVIATLAVVVVLTTEASVI